MGKWSAREGGRREFIRSGMPTRGSRNEAVGRESTAERGGTGGHRTDGRREILAKASTDFEYLPGSCGPFRS